MDIHIPLIYLLMPAKLITIETETLMAFTIEPGIMIDGLANMNTATSALLIQEPELMAITIILILS